MSETHNNQNPANSPTGAQGSSVPPAPQAPVPPAPAPVPAPQPQGQQPQMPGAGQGAPVSDGHDAPGAPEGNAPARNAAAKKDGSNGLPFGIDPKDPKGMMSKPPQRIGIISTVLFFVVAFFIGNQMMQMMNGGNEVDTLITSEFVQAVEQDRVQDVVYDAGNYTVSGTYYPAATAGSTASSSYNSAFEALNAQMEAVLGPDAEVVETTELDEQTIGDARKYTSTFVGQDSLMQLLAGHPDIQYQVKIPDGFWDILGSILPILLIAGLMIFFFSQMSKANNSQMSFGKAKAKEYSEEHPDVTFADVAGEDEAVEEPPGNQRLPGKPREVPNLGREDSARLPAGRPSGHGQDAFGARRCRRSPGAVLQHFRL